MQGLRTEGHNPEISSHGNARFVAQCDKVILPNLLD